MKKLIYFLFTFSLSYFSYAQVTIFPGRDFAECPNEETFYTAEVSTSQAGCQFVWTVTNGVFNNNSTTIYGNPVSVKWHNTTALGKLSVEVYTCDLSSVNGIYSTNVSIKSIANRTPEAIAGPTSVPANVINGITYEVPKMYYPNTGGQGQPSLQQVEGYQWIIPAGWKLGGTTSDGSIAISGGNRVSISPDNCSGNGFKLKVRGVSSCGSGYYSNWSEITINRPLPMLSFTQSPPAFIVCQNRNPITVTVSPVAGATIYTWTKPNGWSGSSTSNSIILTPDGASGGEISVKANICGRQSSVLSKIVKFEIVDPNNRPTISGTSFLCTSNNTFSIQNPPPNTTVNWSVSPAHLFAVDYGTGNTFATRATSSSASGQGTITATLNGPCGSITLPPKSVWVGKPNPNPSLTFTGPSCIMKGPGGRYEFFANPYPYSVPGATSYEWKFLGNAPSGLTVSPSPTFVSAIVRAASSVPSGTYAMSVTAKNICGESIVSSLLAFKVYAVGENCSGGIVGPTSVAHPNPAESSLKFDFYATQIDFQKGYEVKMYNSQQKELISFKSNKPVLKDVDISNVPQGVYIINILHSEGIFQERLIVK